MAYTIRILMPEDKPTNMIFRTKENAKEYLKRINCTYFGNDVWTGPLKEHFQETETYCIEELEYHFED